MQAITLNKWHINPLSAALTCPDTYQGILVPLENTPASSLLSFDGMTTAAGAAALIGF